MLKELSALVIDDECLAREELIELLNENGQLQVIGQANNAIEGLKKINQLKPDVVFLDIQMPQITGIDLLAMLDPEHMPKVVFVTAYDQYSLRQLGPREPTFFERAERKIGVLLTPVTMKGYTLATGIHPNHIDKQQPRLN